MNENSIKLNDQTRAIGENRVPPTEKPAVSSGKLRKLLNAFEARRCAACPLMVGRIFDVTGSYQSAFYVLTGMAVLGLILITQLRPLEDSGK